MAEDLNSLWEKAGKQNEVQSAIQNASEHANLSPNIVHSLIMHESSGNPNARSPTGPVGLGQLSRAAAIDSGIRPEDRTNPEINAKAAAQYYKQQLDEFGPKLAYAAYHDGPQAVRDYIKGTRPLSAEAIRGTTKFAKLHAQEDLNSLWDQAKSTASNVVDNAKENLGNISQIPNMANTLYNAAQAKGLDPTDAASMKRFKEAQAMSPWQKAMIAGGHEVDKLAAGTNEFGYNLAGMIADKWHEKHPGLVGPDVQPAMQQKVDAIAQDQASKDSVYKEFEAAKGIPGIVGASLPYLVDSIVGGPAFKKVGQSLYEAPLEAAAAVGTEGRGLLRRGVEAAASSTNPFLRALGGKAKSEISDPLVRNAMRKSLQIPGMDKLFQNGDLIGSGLMGGIEGGLHYDNSAQGGALSSVIGTAMGKAVTPMLTQARNYRDQWPAEKNLMEWWKDQGAKPLFGEEFGDLTHQKFEAGMKQATFANPMKQIMDSNDKINNMTAYTALGIPRGKVESMTPADLAAHMDDLKSQYQALERGTTAHFKPHDLLELNAHVKSLANDTTSVGKPIYKDAEDYKHQIVQAIGPDRNSLGQMLPRTINGTQIQNIRSRLKADISDSYSNGNNLRAQALKPILDKVDQAIEQGVASGKGTTTAAEWKDLNEKWALTKMVTDHGTNEMGRFDPTKFGNHRMATDATRFLSEQTGPRLQTLDKLAKVNYLRTHQAGSTLSGMGVHADSFEPKPTLTNRLLSPAGLRIPLITNAALHAYVNGYPVKTGLLNMSGKNFGNPAIYPRAYQESQQPYPHMYQKGESAVRGIKDYIEQFLANQDHNKNR